MRGGGSYGDLRSAETGALGNIAIRVQPVVMHTNVDIHISAVGRYEDELVKRGGKWFIVKRVRSE
jgi:hypothetical protein